MNGYRKIATLKGHSDEIISVDQTADPSKLVTVSKDNTARVWDLPTGNLIYTSLLLKPEYNFSIIPSV